MMGEQADAWPDADGWMIRHSRAYDSVFFGPFPDIEEARSWAAVHPEVRGVFIPMYLTVDWGR